MTFYFKTFRRGLSAVMLLVFAATIGFIFLTLPSSSHQTVLWLLFTVEMSSFMRTLWSMIRKPFFDIPQSVAAEGISLFCIFPFHLILALVVATTQFSDGISPVLNVLLQTLAITSSAIHIVYTICLITAAVITACAFDGDVWIRDLDSSPSPFPVPILFAFLYNRLFARGKSRAGEPKNSCQINGEIILSQVSCSGPCDCPPKPPCELQGPQYQDLELGRTDSSIKAKSLPLALVQVPGAAERRASIAVSLEVSD